MRVRLLRRMAGPAGNFGPGHIMEVSDSVGLAMIQAHTAEAVREGPETAAFGKAKETTAVAGAQARERK